MNILLAFDSFKECMSAYDACQVAKDALYQHNSVICPLCDGGEGTRDIMTYAMNGYIKDYRVKGVFLKEIDVGVGIIGQSAVIESAKVCGLELCGQIRNPHLTSTYGLGELILKVIDDGIKDIIVTLGGSATNDCGIGMLSALGIRFYNANKEQVYMLDDIKDIVSIDMSTLDQRLNDVNITVLCDVVNPLCGPLGATYVYGRQKGLKEDELNRIDCSIERFADLSKTYVDCDKMAKGTGAAGGLGFAFQYYLSSSLVSGFKKISEMMELEKHIKECDVVIVGEGQMDSQTQYGKPPYGVLKIAKKYNKNVYAFVGKTKDYDKLIHMGFKDIYEISKGIELQEALKNGQMYLKNAICEHIKEIENDVYSR